MRKMQCEVCGSTTIVKRDESTFECQDCGFVYEKDQAMKLFIEIFEVEDLQSKTENSFSMTVTDSFFISGRGMAVIGVINSGVIQVGESVIINEIKYCVTGIEMFRKPIKKAEIGMTVGLILSAYELVIPAGTIITK